MQHRMTYVSASVRFVQCANYSVDIPKANLNFRNTPQTNLIYAKQKTSPSSSSSFITHTQRSWLLVSSTPNVSVLLIPAGRCFFFFFRAVFIGMPSTQICWTNLLVFQNLSGTCDCISNRSTYQTKSFPNANKFLLRFFLSVWICIR